MKIHNRFVVIVSAGLLGSTLGIALAGPMPAPTAPLPPECGGRVWVCLWENGCDAADYNGNVEHFRKLDTIGPRDGMRPIPGYPNEASGGWYPAEDDDPPPPPKKPKKPWWRFW